MKNIFAENLVNLRKRSKMTQEKLAARLGVSFQSVSKWENDISCPDIMLLPKLSAIFNVSIDALLGCEEEAESVQFVPQKEIRDISGLVMRIIVDSSEGDKVRINLPLAILKMGVDGGMNMPQINGSDPLKGIDFAQLIDMAEKGVLGKLVEVESANGDTVEIFVEEI